MESIKLNITALPYPGQFMIKRWKENGKWLERRGYWFISIHPGMLCYFMNPDGLLRTTDYTALCDTFIWEDKDKEPNFYEAN